MIPAVDDTRRLREIHPGLEFRWDMRREHWNVWMNYRDQMPYIIMAVINDDGSYRPVDNRTFSWLKYLFYINSRNIRKYLTSLSRQQDDRNERLIGDYYDFQYQLGLDMRRPMQMMVRDAGLSQGKSKIPYSPGWSPR